METQLRNYKEDNPEWLAKFKVPDDPFVQEAKIKTYVPPSTWFTTKKIEFYKNKIARATAEERPMWIERYIDWLDKRSDDDIKLAFKKEVERCMEGRSLYNKSSRCTWKTTPLPFWQDVLAEKVKKKIKYDFKLKELASRTPRNKDEAYLFIKYILMSKVPGTDFEEEYRLVYDINYRPGVAPGDVKTNQWIDASNAPRDEATHRRYDKHAHPYTVGTFNTMPATNIGNFGAGRAQNTHYIPNEGKTTFSNASDFDPSSSEIRIATKGLTGGTLGVAPAPAPPPPPPGGGGSGGPGTSTSHPPPTSISTTSVPTTTTTTYPIAAYTGVDPSVVTSMKKVSRDFNTARKNNDANLMKQIADDVNTNMTATTKKGVSDQSFIPDFINSIFKDALKTNADVDFVHLEEGIKYLELFEESITRTHNILNYENFTTQEREDLLKDTRKLFQTLLTDINFSDFAHDGKYVALAENSVDHFFNNLDTVFLAAGGKSVISKGNKAHPRRVELARQTSGGDLAKLYYQTFQTSPNNSKKTGYQDFIKNYLKPLNLDTPITRLFLTSRSTINQQDYTQFLTALQQIAINNSKLTAADLNANVEFWLDDALNLTDAIRSGNALPVIAGDYSRFDTKTHAKLPAADIKLLTDLLNAYTTNIKSLKPAEVANILNHMIDVYQ